MFRAMTNCRLCGVMNYGHNRVTPVILAKHGLEVSERNKQLFDARTRRAINVLIIEGECIYEVPGLDTWSTPKDFLVALQTANPSFAKTVDMATYWEGHILSLGNRSIKPGHASDRRFLLTMEDVDNLDREGIVILQAYKIGTSDCPKRDTMEWDERTFDAEALCDICWEDLRCEEEFSIV